MARYVSPASLYKNLADHLRARRGWARLALAFIYGALSALAFSPANVAPILWVSYPALIFLLQGTQNSWRAFLTGWSFAFGFFVFDIYWTAASMFVDIEQFWWVVPLAALGLPAVFAVYYGIAAAAARRFGLRGLPGAMGFALIWFLADYARGHVFTGFPWNMAGYAWADFLPVLQSASVIGIYGLTLVTLVAACLPAALAESDRRNPGRALFPASLVALAIVIVWGSLRLQHASPAVEPDVRLRLVQPNIDQKDKWQADTREENFQELLDLSAAPGARPVTAIIWPETAATYYLTEDRPHRQAVAAVVPQGGSLITGVLRRDIDPVNGIRYFNSLIAINREAEITAIYDKSHLVPFGEYVPLRNILPLKAVAGMNLDFSRGTGPQSLNTAGAPSFSPLICYEAIFPGRVADRANPPKFLLNITNDGWYGHTAGPHQHFAIARVRAVEEGVPLVRVANTGISGIIDAYGRIGVKLGLGQKGVIDGDLPQPAPDPTYFVRNGEVTLWLIYGWLSAYAVFLRYLARKGSSEFKNNP
ncbi:MAG: apolipoprotein N-acyltransferase [Bdellovibrionales bacterium]